MENIRHQIEYLQNIVDELLEHVEHDGNTGPLIDELIGVAIPNLRIEAGMEPFEGQ